MKMKGIEMIIIAIFFATMIGTAEEINIDIDIKPGEYPNSINLGSNGNIPVAIFSSSTFDTTKVDPMTVTLAGSHIKTNKQCKPMFSSEDVNKDGLKDMLIHIETYALQLNDKDTEAILRGKTSDDRYFKGIDSIKIIGKKSDETEYTIDKCIKPSTSYLPGLDNGPERPVGLVINPDNNIDEFVTNEIEFTPKDQNDLDTFLKKYDGKILDQIDSPPQYKLNTRYLINVNPKLSALDDLVPNMKTLGLKGHYTFSSEDAARFAALSFREASRGVSPNFLMYFQSVPEHPDGSGGNLDAENWWWLVEDDDPNTPGDQGVSTGVIHAWKYLEYMSPDEWWVTHVAIIDNGFALDNNGKPLNNNKDYENSLDAPIQINAINKGVPAGGENPSSYCWYYEHNGGGGGPYLKINPCKWHGQGAFGIAAAYPGNYFGSAGTGGNRITPMVVKTDGTLHNVGRAIMSAISQAEVISISLGFQCWSYCSTFSDYDKDYPSSYIEYSLGWAQNYNVIVVAAAGNGDTNSINPLIPDVDISNRKIAPCVLNKYVLCVGSVNKLGKNLYNYGNKVNIWAPTDIYSTVTPDTANKVGKDALFLFGGTSASTPFVAGVVGMMKMLNPSLDLPTIRNILIDTSNPSTDPKVSTGIIDAYKAVNKVTQNKPPLVKITNPKNGETLSYRNVYLSADVSDPESKFFGGSIIWISDRDGIICTGTSCSSVKLSIGTHTINAKAIDPFDAIGSDSIKITTINNPPSIEITKPVDGSTFYSHQEISFSSYPSDKDEDFTTLKVSWSSNKDGLLGSDQQLKKKGLSIGTHTITATVEDEFSLKSQDSITVNIISGAGYPTVKILKPEDYAMFSPGHMITFEGEANDPEDGDLSGNKLQWYSNKDGLIGTGKTFQKVLSGPFPSCTEGGPETKMHIITLKATDNDGHEISEQITVTVGVPC